MAESNQNADGIGAPAFQLPDKKTLAELKQLEESDESMKKYKETLLGDTDQLAFPDDPRILIVKSLTILVEGQDDITMDLTGDTSHLKDQPVVLKEGCKHRVRIVYHVQREIVSGLKYVMTGYQKDTQVWQEKIMLGSYAPRLNEYVWTSSEEEAPSGTGSLGVYIMRDLLTDDDAIDHFQWEWAIKITTD